MPNEPVVTVRGLKVSKFASQETLCFEATVLIDGVVAGVASNQGTGGANFYRPHTLQTRLTEIASTWPDVVVEDFVVGPGKTERFTYRPDADSVVDKAVQDLLAEKDLKRLLKSNVLLLDVDGDIVAMKPSRPPAGGISPSFIPAAIRTHRKEVVAALNALPFEEALRAFRDPAGYIKAQRAARPGSDQPEPSSVTRATGPRG